MIGAYASAALICAASVAVGHAILLLAGRREFTWLCAPIGLAALVAVSGIAIKLPGHQTAAEIALVVLTFGAVAATFVTSRPPAEGGGRDRRAPAGSISATRGWAAVGAGVVALVLASIPFIASGRVGILGVGLVNDDMAYHLLMADWIGSHAGQMPTLIGQGYPVGPHSLVSGVTTLTGTSLVNGFAGLTLSLPVLTALTASAALERARPIARIAVGALAALSYLAAAYLAQEAFKEPMEALFLLAFALSLPLARTPRTAVPLGVIAAGAVYAYSFPGLFWLIGAGGIYLAFTWKSRPPLLTFVAAAGVVAIAAIPEIGRLIDFTHFKAFSSATANSGGLGNLRHQLSPLEALGIWPSSEFRLAASDSAHPIAYYAGGVLALAAFAAGAPRWVRRYGPAVPGALAAAALIYLAARVSGTVYTSAKALAIASPLVLLVGLGGLASENGERRRRPLAVLGLVFGVAALGCSFLVLRQSPVGPTTHHDELASFRPVIQDQKVLFLGRDDFVQYDLLGARPYVAVRNYYDNLYVKPNLALKDVFQKFDFDSVAPKTLAKFPYVITTRGAYASGPPPWLLPVKTTPDFVLWKRDASAVSVNRHVLDEGDAPGALKRCRGAAMAGGGTATMFARPPITSADWSGGPTVEDGSPATTSVNLPAGRWDVSLQYDATRPVQLTAPGLDASIPANLDYRGTTPYYAAGTIDASGGPVTVSVSAEQPPLAGRILGATAEAHLGAIAFTPVALDRPGVKAGPGSADVTVPLRNACGGYVDWYR